MSFKRLPQSCLSPYQPGLGGHKATGPTCSPWCVLREGVSDALQEESKTKLMRSLKPGPRVAGSCASSECHCCGDDTMLWDGTGLPNTTRGRLQAALTAAFRVLSSKPVLSSWPPCLTCCGGRMRACRACVGACTSFGPHGALGMEAVTERSPESLRRAGCGGGAVGEADGEGWGCVPQASQAPGAPGISRSPSWVITGTALQTAEGRTNPRASPRQ